MIYLKISDSAEEIKKLKIISMHSYILIFIAGKKHMKVKAYDTEG